MLREDVACVDVFLGHSIQGPSHFIPRHVRCHDHVCGCVLGREGEAACSEVTTPEGAEGATNTPHKGVSDNQHLCPRRLSGRIACGPRGDSCWQNRSGAQVRGQDGVEQSQARYWSRGGGLVAATLTGRLKATWVSPDYETSQILTGHGCFRWRLHGFRLCESSMCECGEASEDAHHVLWECHLYEDLRNKMMDGLEYAEAGPVYYRELVASEANFQGLREFAHAWHRRRSGLDAGQRQRRTRRRERDEEEEEEEEEEDEIGDEVQEEELSSGSDRRPFPRTRAERRQDREEAAESRVAVASAPERGEGQMGHGQRKNNL